MLGSGDPWRRVAFTLVGAAWSLRLGLYILIRVWRHHPQEDQRYRTLRNRVARVRARFLLFFELQAVIAVLFSLPFSAAQLSQSAPDPGCARAGGSGLRLLGIAGEATSDWGRRSASSSDPANKSAGRKPSDLWRYSRHPELLLRVDRLVGILPSPRWIRPSGWVTLVCPLLMLYLLLNVTGIPLTEKHSLESRGEAYRAYQRTTSRFVPWIPRKG